MTTEWTIILILYGIGWLFERNERRELALQVCAISYLASVLLVRFPELNFNIPSLGYAVVDFAAFCVLLTLGFRSLAGLFLLSLSLHSVASVAYFTSYQSFFAYYSPIMLILNMGILAVLCVGSTGFNLVMEFYRLNVAYLFGSRYCTRMDRLANELYNTELMQEIEKDFI